MLHRTLQPQWAQVQAIGLSAKPELNGLVGTVIKYDEPKLRVGVEFPQPFGLLSLKHTNLGQAPGGAKARAKRLLDQVDKKGKGK